MAETVKRYRTIIHGDDEPDQMSQDYVVLASDYDRLETVCSELFVDKFLPCACGRVERWLGKIERCKWCLFKDKVQPLLKNCGRNTPNPERSKP